MRRKLVRPINFAGLINCFQAQLSNSWRTREKKKHTHRIIHNEIHCFVDVAGLTFTTHLLKKKICWWVDCLSSVILADGNDVPWKKKLCRFLCLNLPTRKIIEQTWKMTCKLNGMKTMHCSPIRWEIYL